MLRHVECYVHTKGRVGGKETCYNCKNSALYKLMLDEGWI